MQYYTFSVFQNVPAVDPSGVWAGVFSFQVPVFGSFVLRYASVMNPKFVNLAGGSGEAFVRMNIQYYNGQQPVAGAPTIVFDPLAMVAQSGFVLCVDKWKAWTGELDLSALNAITIATEFYGLTPAANLDLYAEITVAFGNAEKSKTPYVEPIPPDQAEPYLTYG